MKFLDLFAGIGGFRLGMERAGHKCVGYVEIDKFARRSYEAIHDTEGEWTREDITKVTDDEWRTLRGTVDIICGGFPCQSFSIAGKRLGFEETRGTLFFEIARAAKQIQPRYLFLENVKGLLSHNKGETFATILTTLHELGYDAEWQILNSKDFGVPQNRERVFIIGHLRGAGGREIFPLTEAPRTVDECGVIANTLTTRYPYSQREGTYIETARKNEQVMPTVTLTDRDRHGIIVLGELEGTGREQSNRIYSEKGLAPTLATMQGGGREPKIAIVGNVNPSKRGMNGEVYSSEGLAPTLTTNKGEGQKVAIIQKARGYNKGGKHDIAPTLSSSSWQENNLLQIGGLYLNDSSRFFRGVLPNLSRTLKSSSNDAGVTDGIRIRKLTPRECWRLQGFPDWAFDRAAEVNSNSQLYKQSGNSVTENVIENIAKMLKEEQNGI
ncbi:DNA (cytosine-5-)-methyltransferase [Listeria monocytogenes]|nr:DNA (cytosine-5-)-methyltransferase [Listeria monocytogenes]MCZ19484.1 DNA (cytosine-5-)-methyltransferase [Listeria monocytogenes serotype 4b]